MTSEHTTTTHPTEEKKETNPLLELFMYRVEVMIEAQAKYFHAGTQTNLKDAKGKEEAVRKAIKELKRRGYSTDEYSKKFTQKPLF